VALHIAKNFLMDAGAFDNMCRTPLILGIWGGKGQGKTFQTELCFKKLGWVAMCGVAWRGVAGRGVVWCVPDGSGRGMRLKGFTCPPWCPACLPCLPAVVRCPLHWTLPSHAITSPHLAPACLLPAACCRVEPIIMSAGELEHEWAGTPGKLIRERYRWGGRVGRSGRAAWGLHCWGWAAGCNACERAGSASGRLRQS
jgi:hypothetical protein